MGNQRGGSDLTWVAPALGGLGAVALGLLYAGYAFGPTEAEVAGWGRVAIILGVALILVTAARAVAKPVMTLVVSATTLVAVATALIQLPPIVLWFVFHGSGISDGTPPSSFVAHWAYALPHAIVAALCLGGALAYARRAGAPANA